MADLLVGTVCHEGGCLPPGRWKDSGRSAELSCPYHGEARATIGMKRRPRTAVLSEGLLRV